MKPTGCIQHKAVVWFGGSGEEALARPAFAAPELRMLYATFPSGVTALCAEVATEPVGMSASSFTAVSLDPPLVSVCLQNSSRTWLKLRSVPRIGISILASHQESHGRQLSIRDGDRFEGVGWTCHQSGAILLNDAAAHLECGLFDEFVAGDHAIVLFEVLSFTIADDTEPLVFQSSRFRRLAAL